MAHPDEIPTIRVGTPEEARDVLGLWRRADAAPSATDHVPAIEAVTRTGALLVAIEPTSTGGGPAGSSPGGSPGGEIVGTLIAAFDGWRGNMYRLAVAPEHRRRGVATALVAAGEARLRDLGATRISALVLAEEDHAVGFWRAAGYSFQDDIGRWTRTLTR